MAAERDPVSAEFDAGARQLLERAYGSRGRWVQTRLADPTPRQARKWQWDSGIDVTAADRPSTRGRRGLDAKTRWCRAFVRSLYYVNAGRGPLRVGVGRHAPALGVIPAGRTVRIMIARGGKPADRAVSRLGDADRIWTDDGRPAQRFSYPDLRDW